WRWCSIRVVSVFSPGSNRLSCPARQQTVDITASFFQRVRRSPSFPSRRMKDSLSSAAERPAQ
ncbi:Uncharacterized protein DAT39_013852, partial [Clarias magur]